MGCQFDRLAQALFLPAARGFRQVNWQPPVDIYRTSRGWLIKYELAGVRPDEIKLTASGRSLRLEGARRDMRVEQDQRSYSMEISYSQFERTLELPCDVDRMEITTDYRDGMLVVRLTLKENPDEPC